MAKYGFILALGAAIVWSVAPLFAKAGLSKMDPMMGLAVRSLCITIALFVFLFLTGGIKNLLGLDKKAALFLGIEGVLGGLIGQYLYFKALKSSDASSVVPIVSSYSFFAFLFAIIILGEKLTLQKGIGALLIFLGLILLGL